MFKGMIQIEDYYREYTVLYFLFYTYLSTSSREMISPFFSALIANSSLVFLYSAKITCEGKEAHE